MAHRAGRAQTSRALALRWICRDSCRLRYPVEPTMSLRVMSPRVAGCCALFVFATSAWAQAPAARQLPPPVSIHDRVRPALPAQLLDFGAYVDSARKAFDVPGIAVAIVKDGHV